MKKLIIDIDGTICSDTNGNYSKAKPLVDRIEHFNNLYDEGYEINYWTARGSNTGKDWSELTVRQLKSWGVKYHSLKLGKPIYDFWIDDKAINVDDYFAQLDWK